MQPVRTQVLEIGRIQLLLDSDNKDPRTRLREPVAGVNQHGANLVGTGPQRLVEKSVVLSSVRGEQPGDILKRDDLRRLRHLVEDAEPFPEKAAAGSAESTHFAGEGEILTGEAGPDDIALRDRGTADVFDGAEVEMAGSVVRGVDGSLLRADVVRPDGCAGVLSSLGDKATAGKEIDEGWRRGGHEFM